jgi:hypothetical protein
MTFLVGDDDRSDIHSDKAGLVNPVMWATLKAVLFAHLTAQYLEHLQYLEKTETCSVLFDILRTVTQTPGQVNTFFNTSIS